MTRSVHRVRSIDAPLPYADMETVFVWAGRRLIDAYGDASPVPQYYPLATEFVHRCMERLDHIQRSWAEADMVVTTVGAVAASVRGDMREQYGDPYFPVQGVDVNLAVTAMEGAGLAREMIASAYLEYQQYRG